MTHLQDYDTEPRFGTTLIRSRRITVEDAADEVRELVLEVDRTDFPFEIGQSLGVLAPASPAFGQAHHFRLYSVAGLPERGSSGRPRIEIAVRRCSYVDEYSGEKYPGVASNFLCDLAPGDSCLTTGPYGLPFELPDERDANLILIASGTGIAPFRAFVKRLYRSVPEFGGHVWLFHGARSGLEMLYMNDERDDFALYYDEETFEAFRALSPRPDWGDPVAWGAAIKERGADLWKMLGEAKTYVFVAGLEPMLVELDAAFADLAGSDEKWQRRKAELRAGHRWVELVY
ncbi:MAG: ferredoxin-NADP reductase [Deltaproteobacteria bacterium]|nr:ferredoxin-NADP reductase [Deltaproteobacteria bacterium]MBW2393680.1 ferredoxin-NADP reductase [Deltaproteobacteria bacterium]